MRENYHEIADVEGLEDQDAQVKKNRHFLQVKKQCHDDQSPQAEETIIEGLPTILGLELLE